MYNVLGTEIMNKVLIDETTNLETENLRSGIYFFEIISDNKVIQTGKLISHN
jgi:hypothetical protein